MKIGLYLCNIVEFTYRSRMLGEMQKFLYHLKDNKIERSPSSQDEPKFLMGGRGHKPSVIKFIS